MGSQPMASNFSATANVALLGVPFLRPPVLGKPGGRPPLPATDMARLRSPKGAKRGSAQRRSTARVTITVELLGIPEGALIHPLLLCDIPTPQWDRKNNRNVVF